MPTGVALVKGEFNMFETLTHQLYCDACRDLDVIPDLTGDVRKDIVLVGSDAGLFVSQDGGAKFTKVRCRRRIATCLHTSAIGLRQLMPTIHSYRHSSMPGTSSVISVDHTTNTLTFM
jgi:hypothetical protein